MHEALFRESNDPIKLQIFEKRIEPYLDLPFYKVVTIYLLKTFIMIIGSNIYISILLRDKH